MSLIAWFTLLAAFLLTTALQCRAAPWSVGTVTETRQNQSRRIGASSYQSDLSGCSAWSVESDPARTTQLLAQNPQPPSSSPDQPQPPGEENLDLSDQVIRDVFEPLQRGMEGHNLYQVLALFDQQETPDYARVRGQFRAFFDQYDAIRFRYQLLQVTSEKNHGSAVAEIEMDTTPADPSQVTLRHETQMRFRLILGHKGWRLVGFAPADFFAK
ncbi:MAG: hypothetical protein WCC92_17485 [Candidatus Korobacteraceae bacterium]